MIHIVDSIMGSGKTTWAINQINRDLDNNYIYCTPFNSECVRIKENCPRMYGYNAEDTYKQTIFEKLLKEDKSICITHEMMKQISLTDWVKDYINQFEYKLILDEVIEVVQPLEINKNDFESIMNGFVDVGENNIVSWRKGKTTNDHKWEKQIIEKGNVILWEEKLFIWLLPISILQCFKDVYILTYNYTGTLLHQYLQINGFNQLLYHINNGVLIDGKDDETQNRKHIMGLIDLYDERRKYNDIDKKIICTDKRPHTPYTKTWYTKIRRSDMKLIEDTCQQYINHVKARTDDVMWSRLLLTDKTPSIRGRYKGCFVACNCRATNDYRNKSTLLYLITVKQNPYVIKYISHYGGKLDQDTIAVNQLLQWVFRSQIRDNKPINLYLPSEEMRGLLLSWGKNQQN